MNTTITIAGKKYDAAPLRLKHLRLISERVAKGIPVPKSAYEDVEPWLPLVLECVKINHPEVTLDTLDEMSGQEFYDAWQAIIAASKVKIVGEAAPIQQTGASSMPN